MDSPLLYPRYPETALHGEAVNLGSDSQHFSLAIDGLRVQAPTTSPLYLPPALRKARRHRPRLIVRLYNRFTAVSKVLLGKQSHYQHYRFISFQSQIDTHYRFTLPEEFTR